MLPFGNSTHSGKFSVGSADILIFYSRMDRRKFLSETDIEEYWKNFTGLESEDDGDFSDTDSLADPLFVPESTDDDTDTELEQENESMENQKETGSIDEENEQVDQENRNVDQTGENVPSTSKLETKSTKQKTKIIWKKKGLTLNDEQLHFHGDVQLSDTIMALETPYQFFTYFVTNELLNKITDETNLYAVQSKPERNDVFTSTDIRQFIGLTFYTSLVRMPNVRCYWSEKLPFEPIRKVMSLNKFEKIRRCIHFNDNSNLIPFTEPGHDRLYKIRPLIDILNNRFSSVPLEQHLSVDEQMCSTKIRHYMKQYLPKKPHKWGFKLYMIAGVTGFCYKFEIYTGQENSANRPEGEPDLGPSSNVVVRLSRNIPEHQSFRLYHDNYYTSVPLTVYLAKKGVFSLGTVQRRRIPDCKLPTEKCMKNWRRGESCEYVATVDGVDISSTVWKDNKYVTMLSSFAGTAPVGKVKRFDRKLKMVVEVDCPFVIREYNRHMGGVDLMDSNIGRYKIHLKSRKWYLRIFYHLLDLIAANAWILYKKVLLAKGIPIIPLSQAEFRTELAESLCKIQTSVLKRGRPSTLENEIQNKKKKGPCQYIPPKDVRRDQYGHWPVLEDGKMRCKYPNCKGFTHTKCQKCGVALCLNKNNNCFHNFHVN